VTTEPVEVRHKRADAVRNRERILEAASGLLDRGSVWPMTGWRTAGSGWDRLPHFPTKETSSRHRHERLEGCLRWPGRGVRGVSRTALFSYCRSLPAGSAKHDCSTPWERPDRLQDTLCREARRNEGGIGLLLTRAQVRARSGATPRSTSSSAWSLEHVRRLHTPPEDDAVSAWWNCL